MRAFRKDFIREITKNKGRFLSVFFIVLLGAAFFSGIRSAEGDMKVSADRYYDEVNYMDLKVLGTLGLTDDDLADIAKTDGVKAVYGGKTGGDRLPERLDRQRPASDRHRTTEEKSVRPVSDGCDERKIYRQIKANSVEENCPGRKIRGSF